MGSVVVRSVWAAARVGLGQGTALKHSDICEDDDYNTVTTPYDDDPRII